jgi:hypothetical protein
LFAAWPVHAKTFQEKDVCPGGELDVLTVIPQEYYSPIREREYDGSLGSVDFAPYINAAIIIAQENHCRRLFFPQGKYTIGSPIVVVHEVDRDGDGEIIPKEPLNN